MVSSEALPCAGRLATAMRGSTAACDEATGPKSPATNIESSEISRNMMKYPHWHKSLTMFLLKILIDKNWSWRLHWWKLNGGKMLSWMSFCSRTLRYVKMCVFWNNEIEITWNDPSWRDVTRRDSIEFLSNFFGMLVQWAPSLKPGFGTSKATDCGTDCGTDWRTLWLAGHVYMPKIG